MKYSHIRTALLLAVVVLSLVVAAACGDDDDDNGSDTTTPTATAPAGNGDETPDNGDDNGDSEAETEFEISMTDNVFTPNELTVPAGETIKFKVTNDGSAVHNMHILSKETEGEDFTSDMMVTPGSDSEFEAVFNTPGTVDFQCDYHLPDMVGTIEVVD